MTISRGKALTWALVVGVLAVDIANGAVGGGEPIPGLGLTPGELVRGTLFVAALLLAVRRGGSLYRVPNRWLAVLGVLAVVAFLHAVAAHGNSGLGTNLSFTLKALYGPALLLLFIDIDRRYHLAPDTVIEAAAGFGALAGLALVVFKLAGIGAATYGTYASAYRGLFLAQNDLSVALLIAVIAASDLLYRRRGPLQVGALLLTMAGMFVLGTRAASIGAVVLPIFVLALHTIRRMTWRRLPIAIAGSVIVLGAVATAGALRLRSVMSESYQAAKYQQLLSGGFTRVLLVGAAFSYVEGRGVVANLVGDGADRYERAVAQRLPMQVDRKSAEVDWIDLWGSEGLLFMFAVYAYYLYFLFRSLRRPAELAGQERRVLVLSLAVFLVHGTLAGHAFANPLPLGLLMPLMADDWVASHVMEAS